MRNIVVLGLFASGCMSTWEPPLAGGQASIDIEPSTWVQGEPSSVSLSYPNAVLCDEESWSCRNHRDATMTVLSATCHGCTFVEDPTGKTALGSVDVDAIANVDGPITINAKLRFDATTATMEVSGKATGDHEVGLAATCALVDSAVLASKPELAAADLRDCGRARTRLATDTVVVFPTLHMAHSQDLVRFCTSLDCRGDRQITATPPAVAWHTVDDDGYDEPFIVMPPLDATTTTIALSLPLATGELSTIALAVPPLAAAH